MNMLDMAHAAVKVILVLQCVAALKLLNSYRNLLALNLVSKVPMTFMNCF